MASFWRLNRQVTKGLAVGATMAALVLGTIWIEGLSARAADPAPKAGPAPKTENASPVTFNKDIRPILAEYCFHCHGPDPASRKANLRLDREEGFFGVKNPAPADQAKSQPEIAVVRGKPDQSPLYQRLISKDPEEVMPPPKAHKTLKPQEIEKVRKWIESGAEWQAHWSFIKPERAPLPRVKNEAWVRNPIDRFILEKLEARGLSPAPEADRRTLARRLSLDLTGLPPEPALVEDFLKDTSPDAYEKLVDKLMSSARYGEHRARYWLDAARYADTHGLHFDNFREIWPYRDWVIDAYNRNQPFDQFTIEQIAGDLLPNPTKQQIVATGFHRCNMTTNEGGTIVEENLANYARDRVETTGWVWLGLTANCAVCHDHKFDPVTAKDFYSMSAFFRNTTQGGLDGNVRDSAPVLMMPMGADETRWNAIPEEIKATNQAIADRRKALEGDFDKWLAGITPENVERMIKSDGLLLHLPLNEGKGDEVKNLAPGGKASFKSSSPLKWRADGRQGAAPSFEEGAQIEVGDVANFERDQPFSYGAWIRTPSAGVKGAGAIFARMEGPPEHAGWDLMTYGNLLMIHLINKWPNNALKVITTQPVVKPGVWQHVMVTYDGSSKASGVRIYVDGRDVPLKAEQDRLTGSTKSRVPLRIARREAAEHFTRGSVQDVRIYNRMLSPAEAGLIGQASMLKDYLARPAKDRTPKQREDLFATFISGDAQIASHQQKLAALEAEKTAIKARSPVAHIQQEKMNSKPSAFILFRGEYDKPRDKVEPNTIASLHPMPADAPKNRLGLAQWLISPENALTPRVIVNRHWQEIFGVGIVKTAEDLGIMGDAPSHPELLDWLSADFRDGGWNVKKLIKMMVMSAAYRQSASADARKVDLDPANRLLSRGPRFRMDAEMIRDYALASAGILSAKIGGPSAKPYQPEGVWEAVAMPESNTRFYKPDKGEGLYRRSMYTFWKRAAPPAAMDILNAPSRETSCVRRDRTNTPLQALVTLNDPQYIEAARHLAQNALKAADDDKARIQFIAGRVLSRSLSEQEMKIVGNIQTGLVAHYKHKPEEAKKLIAVGESKADASMDASLLAAWTMVCNQLLNLDETLNK